MSGSAQYRVVVGKKDEVVDGPDDATLVVSIGIADVGLDPSVAFMQGKLKAAGNTGLLFELLRSGEVAAALQRLSAAG